MAENYTEILLNWNKEENVGDVKVTRTEEVELSGKTNTHEQSSVFSSTSMDDLVAGLENLQANKERLTEKLDKANEESLKVRKDIVAIGGVATLNDELRELQTKIENISMIKELDKLKGQTKEMKDNVADLDIKIVARNVLLNNIREQ